MLILSPRAVERLESYKPAWPLPKIFRMTKGGKLNEGIFEGETINTPSMLCVEDYLDTLAWAKSIGGLKALIARADANAKVLADWVAKTPWVDFLATNAGDALEHVGVPQGVSTRRSRRLLGRRAGRLRQDARRPARRRKASPTTSAYYRDAPPGLRIWCGATVETSDVEALTPWLDWAFAEAKAALPKAA